jgi:DNA-binding transcriptional LysR family regulator
MDSAIELRQLRYFVAVAEELHFGRAADRLHMSQSPLSRAIRDLERDLGVVLFVRTTRRVELTPAGTVLLERARPALAEIDGAVADTRRAGQPGGGILAIGSGPFSGAVAARLVEALGARHPELSARIEEGITPESLKRIGARELAAAVVMASPSAARHHRVRVDTLRDEPLLAALSPDHAYAEAGSIPIAAFAADTVLVPRERSGDMFNAWLLTLFRAHGYELQRTIATLSAPWDRRMPPVASGEAVAVVVDEWVGDSAAEFAAVPFDPPLTFPIDLASCWPATEAVDALVRTAQRVRDAEGWLTDRAPRTELPDD